MEHTVTSWGAGCPAGSVPWFAWVTSGPAPTLRPGKFLGSGMETVR